MITRATASQPASRFSLTNLAARGSRRNTRLGRSLRSQAASNAVSLALFLAFGFILSPQAAHAATPPTILSQPRGASVPAGGDYCFDVLPDGDKPFTYQWLHAGNPIPGATGLLLQLTNLVAADDGAYSVVVSNGVGSVTSAVATLDVADPAIIGQPIDVTAVGGENVAFDVVVAGTAPFQYQWFYNGAAVTNGTGTADLLPLLGVSRAESGNYFVIVSNNVGSITSRVASLMVNDPVILAPPIGGSITGGGNFTFSVEVAGTLPLHLQWSRNGTNIAGATNNILVLSNITATQMGSYSVTVTNIRGTNVSQPVALVVRDPAIITQPTGGAVAGGSTFEFNVEAEGSAPLTYQWWLRGAPIPGATASSLALGGLTPTNAGPYSVVISNTSGSVTSAVANLIVNDPWITAQPKGGSVAATSNFTFTVTAAGSGVLSFQWRLHDTNLPGATASFLTLTNLSADHAGSYSVQVQNTAGTATSQAAELLVVDLAIVTQPHGGWAVIGENFTNSIVAEGTEPLHYQWHFQGAPLPGATASALVLNNVGMAAAGGYFATVSNIWGLVTSRTAYLTVFDPVILSQPVGGSAPGGSDFTFEVVAAGTQPFTYQWLMDGTPLSGETGASLTLPAVTGAQAGNYSVRVSNAAGAVTSAVAILTVDDPLLASEPFAQRVQAGIDVTHSVVAMGTDPFTFQWLFDETPLAGATDATLVLTNVTVVHSGNYAVRVSNALGSVTSSNATLTVLDPAIIEPGVRGGYAAVGEDFEFSVQADGTQPIVYQWFADGTALPGEVHHTLLLTDLTSADSGDYTVRIQNAAGTLVSDAAKLDVSTNAPRRIATGSYTSAVDRAYLNILLEGNGREKGVSFSVSYDPNILANPEFLPAVPAAYDVTSDPEGFVGVAMELSSGTFARTNQQIVGTLSWDILPAGDSLQALLQFADGPAPIVATDEQDRPLLLDTELRPSGYRLDSDPVFDPRTGLFIQRLLVSNPTASTLSNVLVDVYGLGVDSLGEPILLHNAQLESAADPARQNAFDTLVNTAELNVPQGLEVIATLEFAVLDRVTVPQPGFKFSFGAIAGLELPADTTLVPVVTALYLDGEFLIEFRTLAGRDYYVQFTDDFEGSDPLFTTSFPAVRGTGSIVRWIDNGPPKTASPSGSMRWYRVLQAP